MLGNAFGPIHLIAILAVVLLLFGAPKLPGLARSLGQSMRIFRSEVKTMKDENGNDVPTENIGDDTTEAGGTTGTQSNRTPPKSTSAPKP